MGGISLGGAYFSIEANAAPLIQEMAKAEAASKKSVEAISKATGIAEKDVVRFANAYIRAEKKRQDAAGESTLKIIRGYNDAGDAADKAAAKTAKAGQNSAAAFLSAAKGAGAFAAAAVGVTAGATAINSALTSVIDNTRKLEQAQFAINKLYGGSAPTITAQAEALAKSAGRSRADALEGAAAVANLGRQYAFTAEQQKKVLEISTDLAAVKGISIVQATQRVSDALRGEAEAAEYLGQVLGNDAVKAMAAMTDEQRKNFESLSPITKAQITLGKLLGDNNDLLGAAAERTNTFTGSIDKLYASSENVASSIGEKLSPYLIPLIQQFSDAAEATDKWIKALDLTVLENAVRLFGAFATLDPSKITDALNASATAAQSSIDRANGGGVAFGPTPDEVKDAIARYQQIQAGQKDALLQFTAERKRAIDDVADAQEKAYRADARRVDDAIEREKIRLEVERDGRLKALDEVERAAIASLKAQQEAAREASEAAIALAERRKQADIDAVDEAYEQLKKAIDARKDELDTLRELEDRNRDDTREQEDRALEEARRREDDEIDARRRTLDTIREEEDRARSDRRRADDSERQQRRAEEDRERQIRQQAEERSLQQRRSREDRARQQRRSAEDRARADQREAEDRGISDRREQEDRELEAAHDAQLERLKTEHEARLSVIDAEIEAVRTQYEQTDRLREAAHEAAMDDLDAEAEAARRQHDAAVDAIRAQKLAEDDRHRAAIRLLDAEKDARLAAIDAELGLLDSADDADQRAVQDRQLADNVTNAEFGVIKAQSTGNQSEIVKAEAALEDARQAIRTIGQKRDRDIARDTLRARKDAINAEIAARKQAEEDANRLRQQGLDAAERAARDELDAQLAAIGVRRTAARGAYDAERQAARDALDERLKALAAQKKAEDDAYDANVKRIRAEFDAVKLRLSEQREAENRAIEDRRQAEDRDREDRRRKDDDARADRRRKDDDARAEKRRKDDDDRAADRRREDDTIAASRLAQDRRRADERRAEEEAYRVADERRQLQRTAEDRAIDDRREREDRDRQDRRRAEDKELSDRLAAGEANRELERKQIQEHYNGPNGVITQAKKAQEEVEKAYRDRLEATKRQFDEEREAINRVYRNPGKTGLLDLQDEAAKNNRERLADQLSSLSSWKEEAGRFIDDNKGKWKSLEEAIKDVDKAIRNLPKTTVSAPNSQGGFGNQPYGPPDPGGNQSGPNPPPPPPPAEFSNPGGHVPVVRGAGPGTVWTTAGTHGGYPAVDIFAEKGTPIYAPVSGRSNPATYSLGGNATILYGDNGRAYYMAHGNTGFRGGNVQQGQKIGEVGNTGNARYTSPHLHFAIASNARYFDLYNGSGDITGDSSYWTPRDSGYLFRHPTVTYTPATGERNLIAEQRPEMLMGGAQTAVSMGRAVRPTLAAPPASARFSGDSAGPHAMMAGDGGGYQQRNIDISIGGTKLARLVATGMRLELRRVGTLPGIGGGV
jgi:murein DD-endopeptidase MepM/ murein hydrolase activator NlpD